MAAAFVAIDEIEHRIAGLERGFDAIDKGDILGFYVNHDGGSWDFKSREIFGQ